MSLKNYFAKAEKVNAISGLTGDEIGGEVESVGYHEEDIIKERRFIPRVDFSKPENFARYGLATEYYDSSIKRIYGTFPYDGSRRERLEWENESLDIDLYIYDNLYPRTNGYIIFSAEGWGTGNMADGYGSSSAQEYIHFYGGPHANANGMLPHATKFTGSNYYEPDKNRETNLKYDLSTKGTSVEFWLKKDTFIRPLTRKEVVFDLWNSALSSSTSYGRLRIELTGATSGLDPFRVTLLSGTTGIVSQSVGASTFTSASVADGNWHHYAFTFKSASAGIQTRFYVDGELNNEGTYGTTGINEVTGALQAYIGALITSPSGSTALAGYGKLSASLDEFRYWKTQRTSQDVGRYWFTQVGGGTNDDPLPFVETTEDVNTLLGVYYKFNEGITGVTATDKTVLDYSGRVTNGAWTGYTPSSRNTGSAIVISAAAIKEYKDPIIYSFHPSVVALSSSLHLSGSDYDGNNNANIYNTMPQWIREEDEEGSNNIRYLTQIMSSYFDDYQLKAEALTNLRSVEYPSGSEKPLPYGAQLLNSYGFVSPDIFLDADVLEKLADRSEFRVYEKTLTDVKNTIYQNIYNNLAYIYKTKGTEKSFRNLMRCFGIDDELIKLNLYANDIEAQMRTNRKNVAVPDKFVNFNTGDNSTATIIQYQNPADTTNTAGYISASANMRNGYAFTLESEIYFPEKLSAAAIGYQGTNTISASLFGAHGNAGSEATPTWAATDVTNFQVYAVRDELESDNVRFVLTGTAGHVLPRMVSDLYEDVYQDTNWNLSVRVKPESYPLTQVDGVTPTNYVIELHGVNVDAGVLMNEFTITGSLTSPGAGRRYAFVTGSKRVFVGAHRTNFTGSVRERTDVKVNSCRFWLDYLEDGTLNSHAHDTQNAGTSTPHYYAYPFNTSASFGEISTFDTLVFNWEFSTNTGSNALGRFDVVDESSGSNATATANNGWLGEILGKQYSARGFDFAASSTSPIDKDYVIASKQTLPENVYSTEMVKVFNAAEQDVFVMDSRPIHYYFAFEKSLYQSISEEILNYFATLKDLNTLIGAPVNRYRQEYKGLKYLRQKFFATVGNDEIDFNKFYEFYKWFDSSLTVMLNQLVPASTDFAENVRTVIESHVLERSKYQNKFPFLEDKLNPIHGSVWGTGNDATAMACPPDFPAGTGIFANTAYTRRQVGSSNPIRTKEWQYLHSPGLPGTTRSYSYYNDKYVAFTQPGGFPQAVGYNVAIDASWTTPTAFTFAGWLKFNPSDGTRTWFQFGEVGYRRAWLLSTGEIKFGVNFSGANGEWTTTDASLSGDSWRHIAICYDGSSTANVPVIYVDGVAKTMTTDTTPTGVIETPMPHGGHGAIIGSILNAGGMSHNDCFRDGEIATMSLWGKKLSAPEVAEIYNKTTGFAPATGFNPGPQNLATHSAYSDLVSWWRMGSGDNGSGTPDGDTIYDMKGSNDAVGNYWIDDPAVDPPGYGNVTAMTAVDQLAVGGGTYTDVRDMRQAEKRYWWQYFANRAQSEALTGSGAAATNYVRQDLLMAIEKSRNIAADSPVRFGTEGSVAMGGVGFHPNKRSQFVYGATAPAGRVVNGTNIPVNVMLGFQKEVEDLVDTTDIYYPSLKQRLGFSMNPDINRGGPKPGKSSTKNRMDGNVLAPFSLYSSSVKTGYNAKVIDLYHSGVMITNLHHDIVYSNDIPAQGPFTEKFVGGRQHRHIELNHYSAGSPGKNNLDSRENRPEGWMLKLGLCEEAVSCGKGALGITGPQYPDPESVSGSAPKGYLFYRPKANLARSEYAKRPVNIKNILMSTADPADRLSGTILHDPIGNYSKNYQVVQSSGRELNDPFFNDQSFDFAPYPETLAVRGDMPLTPRAVTNQKSVLFDGTADFGNNGNAATWDALVGGAGGLAKPFTVSTWVNFSTLTGGDIIWCIGDPTFAGISARLLQWHASGVLILYASGANVGYTTITVGGATWYHVVGTFAGGTTSPLQIYVNGVNVTTPGAGAPTPNSILGTPGFQLGVDTGISTPFNGYMNDIAVWDRALHAGAVRTLYNNGIQLDLAALAPLAWWRMGNGAGDDSTTIYDQIGNRDITLYSAPPIHKTAPFKYINSGLNYALPNRSGDNSNQSIIVNRFAGSGYEVMSRGYMDPAHESLSVYNALPYHNLSIRNYGLSGSASIDTSVFGKTITVRDQINKLRGLDQRATLHCGQFGHDAAYGSVPSSSYVTLPSWHKTNRNGRTVIKEVTRCTGEFDGADSRVDIGTDTVWDSLIGGAGADAKAFTLSAWVYAKSAGEGGNGNVFSFASSDRQLLWNAGKLRMKMAIAFVPDGYTDSSALDFDKWYHVVATYSGGIGGDIDMYIDGVLDTNVGVPMGSPSAIGGLNGYIGNEGFFVSTWDGYIQNCGIWDRALTAGEASVIYNAGRVARRPQRGLFTDQSVMNGLIAWYSFNTAVGDSTATILNSAPNPPASTDGTATDLTLPTGLHHLPVTVALEKTYDNLYIQHQIPRSTEQYSWVDASMKSGSTIFGLEAPRCGDARSFTQLISGAVMPAADYYGESYKQNFAGYAGRMVVDTVDEKTHLLRANEYSPLDVGTYSGKFNGSTSQIDFGTAATWDARIGNSGINALAFTVSAWFYATGYGPVDQGKIIALGTNRVLGMNWGDHKIVWHMEAGFTYGEVLSERIELNRWYHVVAAYDGGTAIGTNTLTLYLDGVVQGTDTPGAGVDDISGDDYVTIGNYGDKGWDGYICDVGIWEKELSAANVLTLYNGGRPFNIESSALGGAGSDLAAWYRMNPFPANTGGDGTERSPTRGDTTSVIQNRTSFWSGAGTIGTGSALELVRFSPNSVDGLNILTNNRNGPYGWPTWKQIRTGETKVARALRKANKIGVLLPPPWVPKMSYIYSGSTLVSSGQRGYDRGLKSTTFVDYVERPVVSHNKPVYFAFQDNTVDSDAANNISLQVSYANNLEYFTNQGLNNRLNLSKIVDDGHSYNTIADFAVNSGLSLVANYIQRVYPTAQNAYSNQIRERTQFTIDNIWNKLRDERSALGAPAVPNAMGASTLSQSIWPLDGHNNFTTTFPEVNTIDGAGELQNNYSRFSHGPRSSYATPGVLRASPILEMPIALGSGTIHVNSAIVAGDGEFLAATQANKEPYQAPQTYRDHIRSSGKDYSIVPEFRISELMPVYIDKNQGDFLAPLDNIFSLTGATYPDSRDSNFYKIYSNSDFLKYFSVVDDDLNEQRSGDLTIVRDKISLSCRAFLKFLPYKGFYPSERTLELAALFSQSMGAVIQNTNAPRAHSMRIAMEPLFAPGIMYNTIKSGLACSNFCIVNEKIHKTATSVDSMHSGGWIQPNVAQAGVVFDNRLPEQSPADAIIGFRDCMVANAKGNAANRYYVINRVPFETLYRPTTFFNEENLLKLNGQSAYPNLVDSAPSQSEAHGISSFLQNSTSIATPGKGQAFITISNFETKKLYTLAMDNFLCATSDVFTNEFSSFVSAREEDFGTVKKGEVYTLQFKVLRTSYSGSYLPDRETFEMAQREAGFGAPLLGYEMDPTPGNGFKYYPTFDHVTPPYYNGVGQAELVYTASYDGKPTVDEIFSNLTMNLDRSHRSINHPAVYVSGNVGKMMVDECYNLMEKITEVPPGTNEQKFRWLIQSKYETPILNVAAASASKPPVAYNPKYGLASGVQQYRDLGTKCIWRQYATVPSKAKEGVFAILDTTTTGSSNNLGKIVGFPVGQQQRVGALKKEFKWEEAVVAVPFEIHNNRRKFIDLSDKEHSISVTYKNLELAMKKYNFPPRLDFTKFDTVDPILMYVFEFSAAMSQQDLGDMWQNLLPTIGTKFETSEVIVEEKELLEILLEGTSELQWMVFKVKKRVAVDFERNRRAMVTPHTGALAASITEKYSYNWPYDYASLVELVQLEENVQWASRDATSPETITIDYDPLTAPKFNSSACRDDSRTQEGRKRISAAPMPPNLKSSLDNKKADGKNPADWDLPDQGKPPAPPRFEADGKPESKGFDGKIKKKKGK